MLSISGPFVEQEILLIAGSLTAIGIFLAIKEKTVGVYTKRGIATKPASLANFSHRRQGSFATEDFVTHTQSSAFFLPRKIRSVIWDVTLFDARKVQQLEPVIVAGIEYFEMGNNLLESERIITPLLRKIQAKLGEKLVYSPGFKLLKHPQPRSAEPLLSWLASERQIYHLTFWFIEELSQICKEIHTSERYTLSFDNGVALIFACPYKFELDALYGLGEMNSHIEVTRATLDQLPFLKNDPSTDVTIDTYGSRTAGSSGSAGSADEFICVTLELAVPRVKAQKRYDSRNRMVVSTVRKRLSS